MENLSLLTSLDWQAISKDLGQRAFFEENQIELEGPPNFVSHAEIEAKLCQLDELFSHLRLRPELENYLQEVLSAIPCKREDSNTVQRLLKGHLLEISEINKCVFILSAFSCCQNFPTHFWPSRNFFKIETNNLPWRVFVQRNYSHDRHPVRFLSESFPA